MSAVHLFVQRMTIRQDRSDFLAVLLACSPLTNRVNSAHQFARIAVAVVTNRIKFIYCCCYVHLIRLSWWWFRRPEGRPVFRFVLARDHYFVGAEACLRPADPDSRVLALRQDLVEVV